MAELAVILGSGFSKLAGLPLVKEINNYFLRDNAETILKFSSGEFKWIDFANETDKHNGKLNYDYLAYGILLNVFVAVYKEENKEFTSYEDFYQFVIDNLNDKGKIELIKQKSIESFDNHFPEIKQSQSYNDFIYPINKNFQARDFKSLINHLIGDLLYSRKSKEELEINYSRFLDFIKIFDSIDFITLNHDLLLEYLLLEVLKLKYFDGFSENQKILKSSEGKALNLFYGMFSNKINIIKLHGSIDLYMYHIADQEGSNVRYTGEYLYYKTYDYYEKQNPIRYDPISGEKVQTFHWEIDPQFITGTRKEEIIKINKMYKTLYEESESRLLNCKILLIIGYS